MHFNFLLKYKGTQKIEIKQPKSFSTITAHMCLILHDLLLL